MLAPSCLVPLVLQRMTPSSSSPCYPRISHITYLRRTTRGWTLSLSLLRAAPSREGRGYLVPPATSGEGRREGRGYPCPQPRVGTGGIREHFLVPVPRFARPVHGGWWENGSRASRAARSPCGTSTRRMGVEGERLNHLPGTWSFNMTASFDEKILNHRACFVQWAPYGLSSRTPS